MSKNLIENDEYMLTRFCSGKGKLGYQITQWNEDKHDYDWIQLTKEDIQVILTAIKENE